MARRPRRHGRQAGLDVFYNITPSLKLTTTINTDFGETEVDARQINLTRYSVLFPRSDRSSSKAPASSTSRASTEPAGGIPVAGADVYPFFSRQIGLLGGREVPLRAGVKLTGTVGRTDIGMLTVAPAISTFPAWLPARTTCRSSIPGRCSWGA